MRYAIVPVVYTILGIVIISNFAYWLQTERLERGCIDDHIHPGFLRNRAARSAQSITWSLHFWRV